MVVRRRKKAAKKAAKKTVRKGAKKAAKKIGKKKAPAARRPKARKKPVKARVRRKAAAVKAASAPSGPDAKVIGDVYYALVGMGTAMVMLKNAFVANGCPDFVITFPRAVARSDGTEIQIPKVTGQRCDDQSPLPLDPERVMFTEGLMSVRKWLQNCWEALEIAPPAPAAPVAEPSTP